MFALKFFTKKQKHSNVMIVYFKAIQSCVSTVLKKVITKDTFMKLFKFTEDVVIVVMKKNGIQKVFANIIATVILCKN
jgi:hypothetical protein